MSFSAQDVAKLRQTTGAGMMECKSALKESNGDIERASEILRQKGIIAAAKKSEKSSEEGIVTALIANDKKSGVLLEINSQTDFVAKNEMFQKLAKSVTEIALKNKPKDVESLLKLKFENDIISDLITDSIAKIGENIKVRRFQLFELNNNFGIIGSYIHPVGNKIGVLVKLTLKENKTTCIEELATLAKDISMHVAASQPQPEYIDKSQIPQSLIEKEKKVELGKEDLAKKPADIREKIVQGRLDKILAQRCLLEQPFIKDPNITIDKLIKDKSKELGVDIKVTQFVRYNVGESIEKLDSEGQRSPVGSTQ
ncbi:MAG: elongation factor Ts [Candidatus Melainabacteria bacterium]|nr:elongation factor Ts [Candidatus Melainabacteria bacterium]